MGVHMHLVRQSDTTPFAFVHQFPYDPHLKKNKNCGLVLYIRRVKNIQDASDGSPSLGGVLASVLRTHRQ